CPRFSNVSCSLPLHADQTDMLYALKIGDNLEGTTLYVTLSPCIACARVIYTMKIKRVIYLDSYADYKGIGVDEGVEFLRKFGVQVERFHKLVEQA
ncbi:MAG: deaminase, partial [Runella zeae]